MENNFENIEYSNEEILTEEPKSFDWKKEVKEWCVSIVVAVILALVIRTFFFTLVQVSGPSMENTLQNGDRLVVVKFNYEPKQGDIIVFRPDWHPNEPYIKRVIATEGQTVDINFRTGKVYVDDVIYDEPYIKNVTNNNGDVKFPLTVPEDCVFVMGDNRQQSHDGRSLDVSSVKDDGYADDYYYSYFDGETGKIVEKPIYYGCVDEDDIMGKAVLRLWPFNTFGGLK
ncbi:MAG: signal peptidase I [Clostridia bacterium]|nr:signal peptidase I [Clostridia bacterium]